MQTPSESGLPSEIDPPFGQTNNYKVITFAQLWRSVIKDIRNNIEINVDLLFRSVLFLKETTVWGHIPKVRICSSN